MHRSFLFPAVLAVLLISGCAGASDTGSVPVGSASATADVISDMDDLMFVVMMIPHHQQAIEMADLAQTKADDTRVKDLASAIKAAQAAEIAQMQSWLQEAGQDPMGAGLDHSGHMNGMVSDADMAKLRASDQHDFDHLFLTLMVAHHEGAVQMAQQVITSGASAKVRALAESIDQTQRLEIRQMKAIIEDISQHDGH